MEGKAGSPLTVSEVLERSVTLALAEQPREDALEVIERVVVESRHLLSPSLAFPLLAVLAPERRHHMCVVAQSQPQVAAARLSHSVGLVSAVAVASVAVKARSYVVVSIVVETKSRFHLAVEFNLCFYLIAVGARDEHHRGRRAQGVSLPLEGERLVFDGGAGGRELLVETPVETDAEFRQMGETADLAVLCNSICRIG